MTAAVMTLKNGIAGVDETSAGSGTAGLEQARGFS